MEHKTWLWRKRASQKIISVSGNSDISLVENGEEKDEAVDIERSIKDLNEQLSDALTESNAKDALLTTQAKVTEEAISGWKKSEAETLSFKQDMDEVLLHRAASDERIKNLDSSLQDCVHQLNVLKDEKKQIVSDAAVKILREQEKAQKLEEKLADTNRKLFSLGDDNSYLNRVLELKEKMIKELNESKARSEANLSAIAVKLDESEKINGSLKYELLMLQKELEIRNEEREFNLKSADAAQKQHVQNIKRISKLEKECQRLRVMVRNKLPGPAALAKMRTEVEMLNTSAETKRKMLNSQMEQSQFGDSEPEYCNDATVKSVASLIERLHAAEDENRIIKETLSKKNTDLQSLRVMFARTASKLSLAETQLEESPRMQAHHESTRSIPVSYDFPLGSISEDGCNEDSISCTESWASALISELEHFRAGKPSTPTGRTSTSSDFSLMDDFVEMERLAIVSVGKPFANSSPTSCERNICLDPKENYSKLDSLEGKGTAVNTSDSFSTDLVKSVGKLVELVERIIDGNIRTDTSQNIFAKNKGGASPYRESTSSNQYIARVFIWETSELSMLLHHFIDVCRNLLHGNTDLKVFSDELATTLEWIMNHCFPLGDMSNMKQMIKNRIGGNKSHTANEVEARNNDSRTEAEKIDLSEEFKFDTSMPLLPLLATSGDLYILSQMENIESKLTEENKRLKYEILDLGSKKKVLEERLELLSAKNGSLASRLEESTQSISSLQVELETLKEIKLLSEDRIENQKFIDENLGTQMIVTKVELDEYQQKFSNLEVKLEDTSKCCNDLEACPVSPIKLESLATKGTQSYDMSEDQKQLRTDLEISAASKKLAECQETILNLGKQLKSLSSPIDASLIDKMISNPDVKIRHRPQLLDHMREEDAESNDAKSPTIKEIMCTPTAKALQNPNAGLLYGIKLLTNTDTENSVKTSSEPSPEKSPRHTVGALTLLPKKQKGGIGLLSKLLLRRKRVVRN